MAKVTLRAAMYDNGTKPYKTKRFSNPNPVIRGDREKHYAYGK